MKFEFWEKILEKNSKKVFNKLTRKNLFIFPNYKGFQIGALVFFCFAVAIFYQNNLYIKKYNLTPDRITNRELTVILCLNEIRKILRNS